MLEKRRTVRYHVGSAAEVAITGENGEVVAPLVDISASGMMAALPESEGRQLQPGREVKGRLRNGSGETEWQGRIVHRSITSHGIGVGIAFADRGEGAAEVQAAVREIIDHPEAGGIHLKRTDKGLVLEVIGRLSFCTSRECLTYFRDNTISRIDLSRCRSADSAGLGMLCIARERGIGIVGAQGPVKQLLAIARIAETA